MKNFVFFLFNVLIPPTPILLKVFLKNIVKFAEKHICQGLFFNKVVGLTFAIEYLRVTISVCRH